MSKTAVILWVAITNTAGLFFIVWAAVQLRRIAIQKSFLTLMVMLLLWLNPVLMFKFPGLDHDVAAIISRCIFMAALGLMVAFLFFTVKFGQLEHEFKSFRFWAFLTLAFIFLLLTLAGLIEDGVKETGGLLKPQYQLLHKPMVIFFITGGIYAVFLLIKAYKSKQEPVLKFQIETIAKAAALTFFAIVLTNGVVPAFFEHSNLSAVGALMPLMLMAGIGVIIRNKRSLYLNRSFSKLLKSEIFGNEGNITTLSSMVFGLNNFLNNPGEEIEQAFEFKSNAEAKTVVIKSGENPENNEKISPKILEGVLNDNQVLLQHNRYLYFKLLQVHSNLLEEYETPLLTSAGQPEINLDQYLPSISKNLEDNTKTFGQPILCFDKNHFQLLKSLKQIRQVRTPVYIKGEPGSGRGTLARALHYLHNKEKLNSYSLDTMSDQGLEKVIKEILTTKNQGVLFKHLDAADSAILKRLSTLILNPACFVYFTSSQAFQIDNANIPESMKYHFTGVEINTIPLRERPDDLLHTAIWYAKNTADDYKIHLSSFTKQFYEEIMQFEWPGNYIQLKKIIDLSLVTEGKPKLNVLQRTKIAEAQNGAALSALELAERNVIKTYLNKNDFNKNKSARELKITINTLNAKIEKYGISKDTLPG